MIERADEVVCDRAGFREVARAVLGAGDEQRRFAVGTGVEEARGGAEGCGRVGWRVPVVQDEGVVDAEFFEEPEDALGLGVLSGCRLCQVGCQAAGEGDEEGRDEQGKGRGDGLRSCDGRSVYCLPLLRLHCDYLPTEVIKAEENEK